MSQIPLSQLYHEVKARQNDLGFKAGLRRAHLDDEGRPNINHVGSAISVLARAMDDKAGKSLTSRAAVMNAVAVGLAGVLYSNSSNDRKAAVHHDVGRSIGHGLRDAVAHSNGNNHESLEKAVARLFSALDPEEFLTSFRRLLNRLDQDVYLDLDKLGRDLVSRFTFDDEAVASRWLVEFFSRSEGPGAATTTITTDTEV